MHDVVFARELGPAVKLCLRCDELKEATAESSLEGIRRRYRAHCPPMFEFSSPFDIRGDEPRDVREYAEAVFAARAAAASQAHQRQLDDARALVAQQAFRTMRSLGALPEPYAGFVRRDDDLLLIVADTAQQLNVVLAEDIAARAEEHERRVVRELAWLRGLGFGEAEVLAIHCSLEQARSGRAVSTFAMAPFIREHVRRLAGRHGLVVRFEDDEPGSSVG